jgi:hypothetical protein
MNEEEAKLVRILELLRLGSSPGSPELQELIAEVKMTQIPKLKFKGIPFTSKAKLPKAKVFEVKNLKDARAMLNAIDRIQPMVTKAMKLANYVNERADDAASPYSRELLRDAMGTLRSKAKDLVSVGNAALATPKSIEPYEPADPFAYNPFAKKSDGSAVEGEFEGSLIFTFDISSK